MRRLALVSVSLVALSGCKERDPAYCVLHPGMQDCPDAATSGGSCKMSTDCTDTPDFPACDMAQSPRMCVHCTDSEHQLCMGMTPHCDNHECVACVDDNDCDAGAGVCLPTGGCADPDHIIHAKANGSGSDGCGGVGNECTLTKALTEVTVTPQKDVIKLDDAGPYTPVGNNFVVNVDVTIDARGAILHSNSTDSSILAISNNKTATLLGGRLEGAQGSNGDGILCENATLTVDGTTIDTNEKSAINATGGCRLIVNNSTIQNSSLRSGQFVAGILSSGDSLTLSRSSLLSNRGGGVTITSGKFLVIENMFLNNGDVLGSTNGGIFILTPPDSANRLEFNTIAHNNAQANAGVQCTAGTNFIAHNNIIWDNTSGTGVQIGGTCKHSYSDIGPLAVTVPNDGDNNLSMDPLFQGANDLHLKTGSPVHQRADPNADLTGIASKDIDGQLRITPADIGADQMQ